MTDIRTSCVKYKIFHWEQQGPNNSVNETGNKEHIYGTTSPILFLTAKINYMDFKYMEITQQDYLTWLHVNVLQQGLKEGFSSSKANLWHKSALWWQTKRTSYSFPDRSAWFDSMALSIPMQCLPLEHELMSSTYNTRVLALFHDRGHGDAQQPDLCCSEVIILVLQAGFDTQKDGPAGERCHYSSHSCPCAPSIFLLESPPQLNKMKVISKRATCAGLYRADIALSWKQRQGSR